MILWDVQADMERMTLDEFRERFGSRTERRQELLERFVAWVDVARTSGVLRRLWVYGSFPSAKPEPGDIDIVALVTADFRVAALPEALQPYFIPELCREALSIDLFLHAERIPDYYLADILAFLRRDRMGRETMTEILL